MPSWPPPRPSAILPQDAARPAADTAAVVVSFNPPAGLEQRLRSSLDQCAHLILVDNGSDDPPALDELPRERIRRLDNAENRGIAAALNQGVREAAALGCRHALLLDHDSEPHPGMVDALREGLHGSPGCVVCVPQIDYSHAAIGSSRWPQTADGERWRFRFLRANTMAGPSPVDLAISSGMLIDVAKFLELGGFDESLFIDLVDTEFCLLARRHGYRVIAQPAARLSHALGAPTHHRLLGRISVFPTHHSVFRHYHLARNRIILGRRYARRFPSWLIYEWLGAAKLMVKVLLYESQRPAKLWAALRGTMAGLFWRRPEQRLVP